MTATLLCLAASGGVNQVHDGRSVLFYLKGHSVAPSVHPTWFTFVDLQDLQAIILVWMCPDTIYPQSPSLMGAS